MIERSSYEKHPLGRLEWIKLFGVLFGREQQAKAFFDAQAAHIEPILEKEKTGLSVAFLQLHRMERLRYGNQMIMYHQ